MFLRSNTFTGRALPALVLACAVASTVATPLLTWPVFYTIEVGSDGTIWLQDYDPRTFAPPDSWTAIDSTGRILGRLILPPRPGGRRPEVQGFGPDYVIVKRFNEDMAQSIAVFQLLRIDGRSR